MKNTFILLIFFIGMCESHAQVKFQKFIGNDSWDNPKSVTLCSDGSYLIGGTSEDSLGGTHIFMTKLYVNGDTAWTRIYSGSFREFVGSCAQTHDGGYFIAGS